MAIKAKVEAAGSFELVEKLIVGGGTLEIRFADQLGIAPIITSYSQKRRGVERKLILDGSQHSRKVDEVLIRRIVQAMRWLDGIKAGQSISEIATAQDVSPSYITHNLDLALLSPRILEAISEGRQAPNVSAYQLSKISIPVEWNQQDAIFLV